MIRLSGLLGIALIVSAALLGCERTSTTPPAPAPEATPAAEATPVTEAVTMPAAEAVTAAESTAAPALPADIAGLDKLEDVMKQIARSFKFVRTHITDAASDAQSLENAQRIKLLFERAGQLTPELVSRAPEAEQAAKMATFHEKLSALPPLVDELIAALKAGDRETAQKVIGEMHDGEEAGHEAMGVEH